MVTFQLKDVLADKVPTLQYHSIYIIRENRTIFYIGKSENDVSDRVRQHFGMGSFGHLPGSFGTLILENNPKSKRWQVDFLTMNDCRKILGDTFYFKNVKPVENLENREFDSFSNGEWDILIHDFDCIALAEVDLIRFYHPCFNGSNNPSPSPLPKKYQKQQHEAAIRRRKTFRLGFGK